MTESLKNIGRKIYTPPEFYDYLERIRKKPLHIKFMENLFAIVFTLGILVLWVFLMGIVGVLLGGYK